MAPRNGGPESPNVHNVLQPTGSATSFQSRIRKSPPIGSPWPTILLIALVGAGGFVGLLVCSAYYPAIANPLRIAALVWFFGFGLIQRAFIGRQR